MKRIRQTLRSGAHGKLRALLTYNGLTALLEGREVCPPQMRIHQAAKGKEQPLAGMGWYLPSQGYFSGSDVETLHPLMQ